MNGTSVFDDSKANHLEETLNLNLSLTENFCSDFGEKFTIEYYYDNYQINNFFMPYKNIFWHHNDSHS